MVHGKIKENHVCTTSGALKVLIAIESLPESGQERQGRENEAGKIINNPRTIDVARVCIKCAQGLGVETYFSPLCCYHNTLGKSNIREERT